MKRTIYFRYLSSASCDALTPSLESTVIDCNENESDEMALRREFDLKSGYFTDVHSEPYIY